MTFATFCLLQTDRIEQEQARRRLVFLRRVFERDAEDERFRRLSVIAAMISPTLARDIAEWRVEE